MSQMTAQGPRVGAVYLVNPTDRAWTDHRYVLCFGAYGSTLLCAYANSLEDALEECGEWIVDHAPGYLADDSVKDEYERAIAEGLSEEEAQERAEEDTTALDGGRYLNPWEWGIVAKNPSRADFLALAGVGGAP